MMEEKKQCKICGEYHKYGFVSDNKADCELWSKVDRGELSFKAAMQVLD